ncbi:MAG: hypothetical protein ACREIA_05870 [Opitutaceae bacterium]
MRVELPSATEMTIVCPLDIEADELIQRLGRKMKNKKSLAAVLKELGARDLEGWAEPEVPATLIRPRAPCSSNPEPRR